LAVECQPFAPEGALVDLSRLDAVVLDVDGTLVDTNYHHALAWYRAFRRVGAAVDVWRIHRSIGMGGDQLVPAVGGEDLEARHGDDLRAAWQEEYEPFLGEIRPFDGARDLLVSLHDRANAVVLASSGPGAHVEHYLDLLDARSILDAWTTADDADRSKPDPDLISVAMGKVNAQTAVMIGDSTWDAIAAARLGIQTLGVLSGGYAAEELLRAGASAVYDSIRVLGRALLAD
jgi:HAD superfamily hydrolase (TIGR01549 family)